MPMETELVVDMVDGTDARVLVPAVQVADHEFLLLPHDEFDPEETAVLLEYLPGDTVRVDNEKNIVAARMSADPGRAYWALLYDVVAEKPIRATADQQVEIRKKLIEEILPNSRWHYPKVKEWAYIESLVAALRANPVVAEVTKRGSCWTIRLAAPPGFSTELLIDEDAVKWFVTVCNELGSEVWSDYLGYEPNQDHPTEFAVMVGEIEWFVNTMAEVKSFRVWSEPVYRIFGITLGRMKVAEWLRSGEWEHVALSEGTARKFRPLFRERRVA